LQLAYKLAQFQVDRRPADSSGFPSPVKLKASFVPANNSRGLDDNQRRFPVAPDPREPNPEDTISVLDLGPLYAALLNSQLLAESQVFKNDILFAPEYEP